MRKILEYLASHGAFLYEDFGCRITDSRYDPAFGGIGSVTVENDTVKIRFWLERDRLFMDLQGIDRHRSEAWYSMDIVKELLTGSIVDNATMNIENTAFLKERFLEILEHFSPVNLAKTESKCRELEKRRSTRMFG